MKGEFHGELVPEISYLTLTLFTIMAAEFAVAASPVFQVLANLVGSGEKFGRLGRVTNASGAASGVLMHHPAEPCFLRGLPVQ